MLQTARVLYTAPLFLSCLGSGTSPFYIVSRLPASPYNREPGLGYQSGRRRRSLTHVTNQCVKIHVAVRLDNMFIAMMGMDHHYYSISKTILTSQRNPTSIHSPLSCPSQALGKSYMFCVTMDLFTQNSSFHGIESYNMGSFVFETE